METLEEARIEHTYKVVYQGIHGLSTTFINNAFKLVNEVHNFTTRSGMKDDLFVPKTRLEYSKGNIRVRGSTLYNHLSAALKELTSYDEFKHALKSHKLNLGTYHT